MNNSRSILWKTVVWIIAFIGFGYSFYQSFRHTQNTFGTDLRNRIVGSRLMEAKIDPFFYHWNEKDNDEWLDPYHDPKQINSRLSITPFATHIHYPLNHVHYQKTRWFWLYFQYCIYLITVFILLCYAKTSFHWIIISLSILPFTPGWFMHIERGQIYLLYLLIITLIYHFDRQKKFKINTFLIAILTLLRPTFILITLIFYFRKQYRRLIECVLLILIFAVFHVFYVGSDLYQSYFESMKMFDAFNIENHLGDRYFLNFIEVEGMSNVQAIGDFNINNSSIQNFLWTVFQIQIPKSFSLILMFSYLAATLYWIKEKVNKNLMFLALLFIGITIEYFIRAPRMPYNFVLWLPIIFELTTSKRTAIINVTTFILLLMFIPIIPYNLFISELSLAILFFYYAIHYKKFS